MLVPRCASVCSSPSKALQPCCLQRTGKARGAGKRGRAGQAGGRGQVGGRAAKSGKMKGGRAGVWEMKAERVRPNFHTAERIGWRVLEVNPKTPGPVASADCNATPPPRLFSGRDSFEEPVACWFQGVCLCLLPFKGSPTLPLAEGREQEGGGTGQGGQGRGGKGGVQGGLLGGGYLRLTRRLGLWPRRIVMCALLPVI